MTITTHQSTESDRTSPLRQGLGGIAADVGLPLGGYYVLHSLGCSDVVALLGGVVAAAVRQVVSMVRTRQVTAIGTLVLAVYALSLGLAFVSDDPHVVLLRGTFVSGVIGLVFLASLVVGRPMLLAAMASAPTAHAQAVLRAYPTSTVVQRTVRGLTALWGVGLLVDAVVRIPVVFALPVDVGVGVSEALTVAVLTVVAGISLVVSRRAVRAYTREQAPT